MAYLRIVFSVIIVIAIATITVAYPIVYGESYVIDNGLLKVPVKKDGQISAGEYADATAYKFIPGCASSGCLPQNATGYLYVKHDGNWTYFGLDFLSTKVAHQWDELWVYFDTWNTGAMGNNTTNWPGVYLLQLTNSASYHYSETDHEFYYFRAGNASFMMVTFGTTFETAFPSDNCLHYCWQSFFGLSGNDPTPHQQFEVQIRNVVLYAHALNVQHSNQIGIIVSFVDSKGAYNIPFLDNTGAFETTSHLSFVPMGFLSQVVPEFSWVQLTFVISILITVVRRSKRTANRGTRV